MISMFERVTECMDENKIKIISAIDNVAKFVSAGESIEIKCPLCGDVLLVERVMYNGHLHANCNGCGFLIME